MAFQIRYRDNELSPWTELTLSPQPQSVEYPERHAAKIRTTPDGAIVIQRPMRDSRPRTWHWRGYRSTHAAFEAQWATLVSLYTRNRLAAGLEATVQIKENEVAESGLADWVTVKITEVERHPRPTGGVPVYDARLVFHIADSTFTAF